MRKPPLLVLLSTALLALALLALTSVAGATELEGRVTLTKGAKEAKGVEQTLITFTPEGGVPLKVPAEPFEMVTAGKKFQPRTLVVPLGATVRFPNKDNILHNVFSVSGENRFDLGLYRRGEGKGVTFRQPGVGRGFCNGHHSMVAYVAVVETPFHTTAGIDGGFPEDPEGVRPDGRTAAEAIGRDRPLKLAGPGSRQPALDVIDDAGDLARQARVVEPVVKAEPEPVAQFHHAGVLR